MNDHRFELVKILLDKGLLAFLALLAGFWLKKWQEDRTSLSRNLQEERTSLLKQQQDDRLAELQRQFVPRVQFQLHCHFFGPEHGEYIVCISIRAENKGNTRRKFKSVLLRLRGIEGDMALEFRDEATGRLRFPKLLVKDDFVPRGGDGTTQYYYYVEPQVTQVFTYVTKIPADVRYVLAHAKFIPVTEEQDRSEENEFTEERLFSVRVTEGKLIAESCSL